MNVTRIVCPNCRARYDIPRNVIPAEGRDVQCSSCGHTWFQAAPAQAAPQQPPPQPAEATSGQTGLDDLPDWAATDQPGLADLPDRAAGDVGLDDLPSRTDTDAEGADEPEEGPAPPRPALSEQAADVFREERALEAQRRARAQSLESQPELGLEPSPEDAADRRARQARARMARLNDDAPPAAEASRRAASRSDLLPDVDEITQSLRGGAYLRPNPPPAMARYDTRRTGGFSRGFAIAMLLGIAVVAIYAYAGDIATTIPQTAPILSAYVEALNGAREWVDGQTQTLLAMLDRLSSEAQNGG